MSAREIAWLNDYHRAVYEALAPCLTEDEGRRLQEATAPL